MPTFSVIMMLTLAVTFLLLALSIGKNLDWEPWVLVFTVLAGATALSSRHLSSETDFHRAESISLLTFLIVTSVFLSVFLFLAKGIGKGSKVSMLAFLAAIVTFLSIWIFA